MLSVVDFVMLVITIMLLMNFNVMVIYTYNS